MSAPAVLALVGVTASGKSRTAMEIADRRGAAAPVEIVAIDAFTVYRGMDVATAKPSPRERERVRHHLIDALDPWDELTVADFQRRARRAIDDVLTRGATPLLVGGSGLYFRAVVDDLRFPPTDAAVRARIEARYRSHPEAAHAAVEALDPEAAAKIDPANLRRSVRALEVIELTGEAFSSFAGVWDTHRSIYPALEVAYLEPPGEELRDRIHERAARMVEDGLLDEARRLRGLPQPLSTTAGQAIGYAEAFAVLDGQLPGTELADAIARRTWRYARRQRSWFRRDPRCQARPSDAVVDRFTSQQPRDGVPIRREG